MEWYSYTYTHKYLYLFPWPFLAAYLTWAAPRSHPATAIIFMGSTLNCAFSWGFWWGSDLIRAFRYHNKNAIRMHVTQPLHCTSWNMLTWIHNLNITRIQMENMKESNVGGRTELPRMTSSKVDTDELKSGCFGNAWKAKLALIPHRIEKILDFAVTDSRRWFVGTSYFFYESVLWKADTSTSVNPHKPFMSRKSEIWLHAKGVFCFSPTLYFI